MRQIEGYQLWIGNAGDLLEPNSLFDHGIKAIVELADNEPFAALPRDLVRLRFPLGDGGDNHEWLLRLAIDSIADLIRARVPTLVSCSCGMNRSVAIAAASIARAEDLPLEEALRGVASNGPADVAPSLLAEVRAVLNSIRNRSK